MLEVTIDLRQIDRAEEMWRRFPKRLQRSLRPAMIESLKAVASEAKSRAPVRTGDLRRRFNADFQPKESTSGAGWTGRVGGNVPYGRYQEFGFHGTENVRQHTRHHAFGRETKPFSVGPYSRTVNYAGKPYARPGLAAAMPQIGAAHRRAIRMVLDAKNWGSEVE